MNVVSRITFPVVMATSQVHRNSPIVPSASRHRLDTLASSLEDKKSTINTMPTEYDTPRSASMPPTKKERQGELNETIRIEFEFLKYIERIEDKAPDMVKDARIRWLNAICAGVEFVLKAPDVEQSELFDRLVSRNTQMRQEVYTVRCGQGPTTRERWLFPWERDGDGEHPSSS